jgi:predicted ABC-class ATPase
VRTPNDLTRILTRIDRKGYGAYKEIKGEYNFGQFVLIVDHVQADPFASPSKMRIRVKIKETGLPEDTYNNRSREIALRDYLTRVFFDNARRFCKGKRGSGKSGLIGIARPGQEILERSSVVIKNGYLEVRFIMGLPAHGRTVTSTEAEKMFFNELLQIVKSSLFFESLDKSRLYEHVETSEDADFLRSRLKTMGLVAFVAEGAILPRSSGVEDTPMRDEKVVPFKVPDTLKVAVKLPNRGEIVGMGISEGVTLIVGGGYHGKSTLLNAIELGIYNHIPGDGREFVVTVPDAVKIRAEDGRRIEKVDISPFINNLPFGQETKAFSTEDASGSTSQAANIIETLEAGTSLILIDEDTSATNFMIRDYRMQQLLPKSYEPITPFIDKVRLMYRDLGVSTILVIGGSGEYFDVADSVICMIEYCPYDFTEKAKEIAERFRAERLREGGETFGDFRKRIPVRTSFDPSKGRREVKITSKGLKKIVFGRHEIDLSSIEQLVDPCQTNAIGDAILHATRYMDGEKTLREVAESVIRDIETKGLDILSPVPSGDYAFFRKHELVAAINRLRTLRVRQK